MFRRCAWLAALFCAARFVVAQPAGLPGAGTLTWNDDLSVRMMDGAHRFVERKIAQSIETRQRHWQRDLSSRESYDRSIALNRKRFIEKIGAVDPLLPGAIERFGAGDDSAL